MERVAIIGLGMLTGPQPGRTARMFDAVGSGADHPLADWGQHRLRWPQKDLETATVEQLRALR